MEVVPMYFTPTEGTDNLRSISLIDYNFRKHGAHSPLCSHHEGPILMKYLHTGDPSFLRSRSIDPTGRYHLETTKMEVVPMYSTPTEETDMLRFISLIDYNFREHQARCPLCSHPEGPILMEDLPTGDPSFLR
jgi:hypothetical protein